MRLFLDVSAHVAMLLRLPNCWLGPDCLGMVGGCSPVQFALVTGDGQMSSQAVPLAPEIPLPGYPHLLQKLEEV